MVICLSRRTMFVLINSKYCMKPFNRKQARHMANLHTSSETSPRPVSTWRDRMATGLMLLAAVSAFIAFISDVGEVAAASPATLVVELWRLYGFFIFTGLFVLLAFWPRRYPGIWELVLLDKAILSMTGLVLLQRGVAGVQTVLLAHGFVLDFPLITFVLSRGEPPSARPPVVLWHR